MSTPRVLVVGDVMLDVYITGRATRVSPESPCVVVNGAGVPDIRAGGAANVAANISRLGAPVTLIGAVGDSDVGVLGRCLPGVFLNMIVGHAETHKKTRVYADNTQLLRYDSPESVRYLTAVAGAVRDAVMHTLTYDPRIALVVVSDYEKGLITAEFATELCGICRERNLPLLVDAKPAKLAAYAGASLVCPNLSEAVAAWEACSVLTLPRDDMYGPGWRSLAENAAYALASRYRFGTVVVTCGAHGAVYCSHPMSGGDVLFEPSEPVELADVSGAGDTFLAALACCALAGLPLSTAMTRANVAAGIAVRHPGTYVVSRREWLAAIKAGGGAAAKVMTLDAVVDYFEATAGKQGIVLVNGCFDGFHYGHFTLLQGAAQYGRVLVAVNTDESVRALKGAQRPLVPLAERLACIAALDFVEAVIPFDGAVAPVAGRLRPAVLVKGAEYENTAVPGADEVAAHGGNVVFLPMRTPFHSSCFDRGAHV